MEVYQNFTDRSCAFKGKRTKRSRPSSPLDITGMTTITTTSSSTAGGSDDGGRGGGGGDFYNSPTTSTTQISTTSTSEEDEDMANCLILLAQSGCGQKVQQVVAELKKEKISSKKFAEMTTSTTGKAGFYVYECKTCNRTFPSFQALGGHRASHKKPKTIVEEKKSVTVTVTSDTTAVHDDQQQHQENDQEQGRLNKIRTSHSNRIVVNNSNNNNNNKTKIHECSICGSEFSSGQALGGHMRRHRPPTTTTTTTAATTNTKISTNIETTTSCNNVSESSSSHHDEKSTRNILSLDLNLPAPSEEDDHKFEQSLVFSAAPLVDCYY